MLHKLTKEQGGGRHLMIVKRPRMQDLKLHLIIVKTDNDDNNAQDALHKNGQQNFHFQSE